MKQFLPWIGHRIREASVFIRQAKKAPNRKKLFFFPSNPVDGGSSQFRAYELSLALEKFGWNCEIIPAQLEYVQRLRIIKKLKPDFAFLQQGFHPLNHQDLFRNVPYFLI